MERFVRKQLREQKDHRKKTRPRQRIQHNNHGKYKDYSNDDLYYEDYDYEDDYSEEERVLPISKENTDHIDYVYVFVLN